MRHTVESILNLWRGSLRASLSDDVVEDFLRQHGAEVSSAIAGFLAKRRARAGELPKDVETWDAYSAMVDSLPEDERMISPSSDLRVLATLLAKSEKQGGPGFYTGSVMRNFTQEYIDLRAECILARKSGWDLVPVMTSSLVTVLMGAVGPVPLSRYGYFLYWENPMVAVRGPRADKTFAAIGFAWSDDNDRYECAASDGAWRDAKRVVESLTPEALWSTPDNRTLSQATGLNYSDSWWTEQPSRPRTGRVTFEPFSPKAILVRGFAGAATHDPDRGLSKEHYHRNFRPMMSRVEERLVQLRDEVGYQPSDLKTTRSYARKIWALARASAAPS